MSPPARQPLKEAVSLTKHPASLPQANIHQDVDHAAVAATLLKRLDAGLSASDLTDNAIWRDQFALTGTLRTFFKPQLVMKAWQKLAIAHKSRHFELIPESSLVMRLGESTSWVQAMFSFHTIGSRPARCSGVLGLVPSEDDNGGWKIWMLSTILEQPNGYPDVDHLDPATPSHLGSGSCMNGSTASATVNTSCPKSASGQPEILDCVVVGAGIAGLSLGARLKALGLSYLVIEKHARAGDNWLYDRYASVKLHTSRDYSQMPHYPRTFKPEDPYHLKGTDVAAGFRCFAATFGIDVRTSSTLESAKWNEGDGGHWVLQLQEDGCPFQLKTRHVVLATGSMGGVPNIPKYTHRDRYKGDVTDGVHWHDAKPWTGRSGIVIGSANTAHDVILDMASAGMRSITMIQRSPTFILPMSTFGALVDPVYNQEMPVEISDRLLLGPPLPVQRLVAMAGIRAEAEKKEDYFDQIEAQGYRGIRYGDLWGTIYDREGGHFFDLGAGELIVNGTVKVRSDALPVAYTPNGLELDDGSQVNGDVIVFATGYQSNIKGMARKIFGDEIAEDLQEFFQCDAEGEIRGAWRDTGHPNIHYTGHGFAHARFYARFIAMRIKADVDGEPIVPYLDTPEV